MIINVSMTPNKGNTRTLTSTEVLRYLLGIDENLDTLIKCKPDNISLICIDHSMYEAMGSIKNYEKFDYRKLVKFLESVDIISYKNNVARNRPILTDSRVESLLNEATNVKVDQTCDKKSGPKDSADDKKKL
jgi:hypothetical protein